MNFNAFDIINNINKLKGDFNTEKLAEFSAEGNSGGGLVKIVINGKFNIQSLQIDPIAVDNRDIPMLQDLIIAAHSDAVTKLQEILKENMLGNLKDSFPGMNL
ncbi:MAG: DNA-binding protein [Treponema sp.]|nr:MAG: DNA-binding protein [Treponema sp.]